MARAVMIQGTGSDVGKSLIVAGLCRACRKRGIKVAPFKPQNMSNNAAVADDGGEIGRAQALQARAAGVASSRHMNPVLLKPQADRQAQIIVQGQVTRSATAQEYRAIAPGLLRSIHDSYDILAADSDLIIVEGAGSPAEINLRLGDIANMGFAESVDIPVLLVGDIDRGGVIAQLVGTWHVLPPAERTRIKGFIVNKFRGDVQLFAPGAQAISAQTGWRNAGIVPYFDGARLLPAEDSLSLTGSQSDVKGDAAIRVAVLRLPHIANFDDIDPLMAEPALQVSWVEAGSPIPASAQLVILPGSKATLADLNFIYAQGWDIDLQAHYRRGGSILGLCGGFQMLGAHLADEAGLEGGGAMAGLGFLEMDTTLTGEKQVSQVQAKEMHTDTAVTAYEIHLGRSSGPALNKPWFRLTDGREEGAFHDRLYGTYLHGVFTNDTFREGFLRRLRSEFSTGLAYQDSVDRTLDDLAGHLAAHLDIDFILAIAGLR